ncbi:MAG: hypothetical protein J6A75_01005 [Lachnospiraceae bacterium]|nr:hypothetical protein [Lachnospiraceae bacterium]
MSIKEKEQELFREWKEQQGYPYFISDGLMDESEWNQQKCKILFVLKEANWEGANADLCEFLLSEKSSEYWKTWNNIARWTKAVLEGGDYQKSVSKADKSYWIRKIAAMNLKKVGGDSVAEDDTIRSYAQRDKSYLKRQITLYEPDIIICCGRGEGKNADILHDIVFDLDEVSEWKEPILQYNYFLLSLGKKKNIPVVSFYHPQMRGSHTLFEKRFEEMKCIAATLRERYM